MNELPVKRFEISGKMALEKGFPTTFEAIVLQETAKAVFVKGHGVLDATTGRCCRCGRTLTHPGSIVLGIGPECLGNWELRKDILNALSPETIAEMKTAIAHKAVEGWLPKYCINSMITTGTTATVTAKEAPNQPATAQLVSGLIKMTFNPNPTILTQVKSLSGRRYFSINNEHYWTAPVCTDTLKNLAKWGFALDAALQEKLDNAPVQKRIEDIAPIDLLGLKGELRPFQAQGIAFVMNRNGNAIIGDEMGLGKTVQALGFIHQCAERPAIVVMPASLKGNWAVEAKKWLPNPRLTILSGRKPKALDADCDIILINYDVLDAWVGTLKAINPKIVVLDECHFFKNNGANRTKAVKALCKGVDHVIPLSGTPALNRPVEVFNAVKLVEPSLFPTFMGFAQRYCNAHHNGYGWDFSGASNLEELYDKLSTVMIRRKKSDVLKELPEKVRSFVPMELTNTHEYTMAENEFINWVKSTKGNAAAAKASNAEHLARITALRQLAVKGALKNAIAWIRDFLDGGDQKLVVMAIHKEIIDALMAEFGTLAVKIDGSTPVDSRQSVVERFQNDSSCQLFVGNIKAAGVGITLTAASNVTFLELPWTPGELDQAEDRVHRIGQKNAVNIWYLLATDTIEEELAHTIDKKRQVLAATLDGTEMSDATTLSALMSRYTA